VAFAYRRGAGSLRAEERVRVDADGLAGTAEAAAELTGALGAI
jgi:hypothetical protein